MSGNEVNLNRGYDYAVWQWSNKADAKTLKSTLPEVHLDEDVFFISLCDEVLKEIRSLQNMIKKFEGGFGV